MAICVALAAVLASAGSLVAHHSLAQFDTTKAVRVKGTLVRFERMNPHSILFVDQKGEDGQIQRWAVEGPSHVQLGRRGFDIEVLKAGDIIEACGYILKNEVAGSQLTVKTEPLSESLKATTPKTMSGRLMDGELLVMPNGQKQVWSDYGHHKCFAPDYQDFHGR
jgi:lysyl-tRNA synthetase class II